MDSTIQDRKLQAARDLYQKIEAHRTNTKELCAFVSELYDLMAQTHLPNFVQYFLVRDAMPVITEFLHDVQQEEPAYFRGLYVLLEMIHADLDTDSNRTDDRAVIVVINGLFDHSTQSAVAKYLQTMISKYSIFVGQLMKCGIEEAIIDILLDTNEDDSCDALVQMAASLNEVLQSKELLTGSKAPKKDEAQRKDKAQRKDLILQTLFIMKRRMQKGKDHDWAKTLQNWLPILIEALRSDPLRDGKIVALALKVLRRFFSKKHHPYGDIVKKANIPFITVGLLTEPDEVAVEALKFMSVSAPNEEICREYNYAYMYRCLQILLNTPDNRIRAGVCCALRGLAAGIRGGRFAADYDVVAEVLTVLQPTESKHVKTALMDFLTEVIPRLQDQEQILPVIHYLFQQLVRSSSTRDKGFVLNVLTKCLPHLKHVDKDETVEVVETLTVLCSDPNEHIRTTACTVLYAITS